MLLVNDLVDIKRKTDYLLELATKLKQQPHCASTAYDQHVFSSVSKELLKFMKTRMEPNTDREDFSEHRNKISA